MFKSIATTVPADLRTIVGDVNGDGKADFLQISDDGSTITVLLGNGDGTTVPGGTLTPSGGAAFLALGDVNGDGKLDLAVTNAAGTSVTLALGNGNGSFQTPGAPITGSGFGMALGDLNGDGRADLVTVGSGLGVVRLGNANGTFSSPVSTFSARGLTLQIGDVTGDGKADIVFGNTTTSGDSSTVIIAGRGDGSLGASQLAATGYQIADIGLGDVNGDGRLDIVALGVDRTFPAVVLVNAGDGTFLTTLIRSGSNAVALGDVDGNGRPDIIFPNASILGDSGSALLNFASPNTPGTLTISATTQFVAAPVDADGTSDSRVEYVWQRSNGSGGFDAIAGATSSVYTPSVYSPAAADNGHDLRAVARYADGSLNVENPISQTIHAVVGSTAGQTLTATGNNDFISAQGSVTSSDPSLRNTAVFATSVRIENTVMASSTVETATVVGPGGHDALYHVGTFAFLDGDLTVDANGSAAIVTRLYEAAFGRDPDSIGLSHFTTVLDHGTGVRDVALGLTGSQEFQSHEGALANAGFVSAVYGGVLHRTADSSEVSYWQGQLDQGTSRADVIVDIAQSGEAVGITLAVLQSAPIFALDEHAAQVARLYDTAFGRDPDRAGLEVWRGFLDQGGPGHALGDVANAFAASSEFAARYGQSSTDAYVTALYQNTLHRTPDDAGRAHWNAVLDGNSETRAQVALDFSESAEHQNLLAPHIQDGIHLL